MRVVEALWGRPEDSVDIELATKTSVKLLQISY